MLTTTNFKLKKPESTDYAKISDLNDNADIIDAEIAKRPTRDDMDDVIDTKFTTSTSRAKLTPGEKLKALFGKIERWLEDLKDGAFSTVVNNVTTTDAGFVLDARQGKVLKDQIDTKANKADVVNNLTTTDYGYILDARQGKALNDKINDAKSSLDASIATKLASANIVNNVTTTNTGYALDARQGKALNDKIDSTRSSLQSSFQAGVDGIYNAITAQGTTPESKSQGDVKNAIKTLADAKYAAGHQGNAGTGDVLYGKTFSNSSGVNLSGTMANQGGYTEAKSWARGSGTTYIRIPKGAYLTAANNGLDLPEVTVADNLYGQGEYNNNYNSGYSKGVTDADNRANSNSTNYKSGYNAGYSSGKSSVKTGSFVVNTSNTYDGVWCRRIDNYDVGHTVLMAGITARPKTGNYVVIGNNASWGIQVTWSGSKISVIIPYAQAGLGIDSGPFGDWTITYAYYA